MGKGLAREFRIRYPYMFLAYKDACAAGHLTPGGIHYYYVRAEDRTIYNLATKDHWRNPSKLEWVELGLANLSKHIRHDSITSIAIPPLGCGLGGLAWSDVLPRILTGLAGLNIDVEIYQPNPLPRLNIHV